MTSRRPVIYCEALLSRPPAVKQLKARERGTRPASALISALAPHEDDGFVLGEHFFPFFCGWAGRVRVYTGEATLAVVGKLVGSDFFRW